MKLFATTLIALAAFALVAGGSLADDKKKDKEKEKDKETTLTGSIMCAKCALKEKGITKCTNAIQVKEKDKTVTYYLDDKGMKEDYHEAVCGGEKKEGTVKGVVSEKDGKKWVKPSKVEYKK